MNKFDDSFENDLKIVSEWILEDIEQIALPESLKSEHLMCLLKDKKPRDNRISFQKNYYRYVGLAACLALAILATIRFTNISLAPNSMTQMAAPMAMPQEEAAYKLAADAVPESAALQMQAIAAEQETSKATPAAEQYYAKSYDDVYALMSLTIPPWDGKSNPPTMGGAESGLMLESTNDVMTGGGRTTTPVYQTNTQIEGVDEADIVKTDGSYLYHYRHDSKTGIPKLSIVAANNLKEMATISMEGSYSPNIYLSGKNLVVVEDVPAEKTAQIMGAAQNLIIPEYAENNGWFEPITQVAIYDVSDKSNPKLAHSFYQSGSYENSRLSDNVVYTVTNQQLPYLLEPAAFPSERYIPFTLEQSKAQLLPAESIWIGQDKQRINFSEYTVVSALDLNNGFAATTKAIAGNCDEMLLTNDSLYLTTNLYTRPGSRDTGVIKFVVDRTNISYVADTTLEGYIDNQFALDEYRGNLRIATTSRNDKQNTQNGLYILDKQLKPLGEVTGLAENETIYSVRYIGEYAYIVTFRQTDPLFVIDLSDPRHPVVKGELKIPGFSEYLHPIDQNTLVGIGQNTRINEQGGVVTDGLKLSLFDVSDPAKPTEKSNLLIGNSGSNSAALYDHKAVMYYPEQKLLGLPAEIYRGEKGGQPVFSGYMLFEIKDGKLEIKAQIENLNEDSQVMRIDLNGGIDRGVYIGETLYTLSASDVRAFAITSDFKQIGLLKYSA